jgi:CheY-like chemotaxis protein
MEEKHPHILIVEDSEVILTVLKLMFELQGWKVSERKNLSTIIDDVKQIKPDLILMDMMLSGSNGCDACKVIKQENEIKNIPIIIMSAHPEAHQEANDAGANYFIAKPFEMDQLISKVQQALDEYPK